VKLSHHPDGKVHFSQDGKIISKVGRRGFSLRDSIGLVFQLHSYHPSAFSRLMKAKAGRAYLPFLCRPTLPKAITIEAQWRRRSDVEANIEPQGRRAGPLNEIIHRKSGARSQVFFVGQPQGFPLRDHVLLVSVEPTRELPNITDPTMILVGGFDPHEGTSRQEGLLSWMYPHHPSDALRTQLGTVDLPRARSD
jgi:hypothetical protein